MLTTEQWLNARIVSYMERQHRRALVLKHAKAYQKTLAIGDHTSVRSLDPVIDAGYAEIMEEFYIRPFFKAQEEYERKLLANQAYGKFGAFHPDAFTLVWPAAGAAPPDSTGTSSSEQAA